MNLVQNRLALVKLIKTSANHTTMRHYRSQPMPVSYSKNFAYVIGTPQPSQMQQAFIRSAVKASKH